MKIFWITLLSLITSIAMAHPGHGSHEAILASGELHPWLDSSMLIIFIIALFLSIVLLIYKKQ